jgi:hypothetical protein
MSLEGLRGLAFYPTFNAEFGVLRAAEYADEQSLWIGKSFQNKAKVPVTNTNIGTSGGVPTNIINVYRTPGGFIHGSPGNP